MRTPSERKGSTATQQETPRLGISDFTFLQVLGKGSFGKVGMKREDNEKCSVLLALHFLSEVDGLLAAAALVSSPERHSGGTQGEPVCTFFIYCIYNSSPLVCRSVLLSRRRPSATLEARCNNTYKRRGSSLL